MEERSEKGRGRDSTERKDEYQNGKRQKRPRKLYKGKKWEMKEKINVWKRKEMRKEER